MYRLLMLLVFIFVVSGILYSQSKAKKMEIKLQSPDFKNGELIPSKYTCDGENISPALNWNRPNDRTKNYCIIVSDPDAPGGDFTHWIVFDIPANVTSLLEDVTTMKNLPDGAAMGTNDGRRIGYFGPCPPSGTHRYIFRIYAIDNILKLDAGATKKELLKAMEGHIVEQGELTGKYQRQR